MSQSNGKVYQSNGKVYQSNGIVDQSNGKVDQSNGKVDHQSNGKVYHQSNGKVDHQSNGKVDQSNGKADQSNHLVFVYGTLKRGEPNYDLIEERTEGKAVFVGRARTVQKWPLVIASRYNLPYILYSEGKGRNIFGEIYEVDDVMLENLDELENHPKYYTRVEKEAELIAKDGSVIKKVKPWIYFLKNFRPELLDLPCLSGYSSKGSHGLEYVSRDKGPKTENYYSDVMNVRKN